MPNPPAKTPLRVAFDSAAALRALRERTGLSQAAFARLVQIDPSDVSRYESGQHSMTLRRLDAVARRAGVELRLTLEPRRRKVR